MSHVLLRRVTRSLLLLAASAALAPGFAPGFAPDLVAQSTGTGPAGSGAFLPPGTPAAPAPALRSASEADQLAIPASAAPTADPVSGIAGNGFAATVRNRGGSSAGDPAEQPEPRPLPSDVLTPNVRRNTPNLKVALRAGFNRTAYSNERYLDNTLLDVGQVSGETDVYGSAAGFGYLAGLDIEYPFTTGLSLVVGLSYEHIHFGNDGGVQELCQSSTGEMSLASSVHSFDATIDYAKLAAALRLSFTRLYFTAGLTTAHPVNSTLTRHRTLGGTDCFFPGTSVRSIDEEGEIPSTAGLHYSIRLGAGLIYHIGERLQFSPELTLDFGTSRINKSPNSDIGVYSVNAVIRYDL